MFKSLVATTVLLTSLCAQAGLYNSYHGQGLPLKVGEDYRAVNYRNNFMNEMGITAVQGDYGLTQFEGNEVGFTMLKMKNENEGAFKNILAKAKQKYSSRWGNGKGFISSLRIYTQRYGCIPKITSVSHGWGSTDTVNGESVPRQGEGKALSGPNPTGSNGVYAYARDIPRGWYIGAPAWTATSLDRELYNSVRNGSIKFCNSCIAQFYACNIATDFAKVFAQVSGCQTVVGTGQNSPVFQNKEKTHEGKQKIFSGAHYWGSFAAFWGENGKSKEAKALGQEKPASWYRATPVKNNNGQIVDLVEENLGSKYISL